MFPPLRTLANDLAQGRTTARALIDEALSRIDDPQGEGSLCFVEVSVVESLG
jgi:aspartyl-tRNA(Asn)/glutamyl-tRNA(Gln) amidotransferase subunit A